MISLILSLAHLDDGGAGLQTELEFVDFGLFERLPFGHRVLSASPTEPASGLVPSGDARMARGAR